MSYFTLNFINNAALKSTTQHHTTPTPTVTYIRERIKKKLVLLARAVSQGIKTECKHLAVNIEDVKNRSNFHHSCHTTPPLKSILSQFIAVRIFTPHLSPSCYAYTRDAITELCVPIADLHTGSTPPSGPPVTHVNCRLPNCTSHGHTL
jgi:hypothetical protein